MLTVGLLLLAGGCGSDSAGGGPRSDVNYWRAGLRAAPAPAGLSGIIGFDRTLLVPGRADPLTHDLVLASANAGFHAPDAAPTQYLIRLESGEKPNTGGWVHLSGELGDSIGLSRLSGIGSDYHASQMPRPEVLVPELLYSERFRALRARGGPASAQHEFAQSGFELWSIDWYDEQEDVTYTIEFYGGMATRIGPVGLLDASNRSGANALQELADRLIALRL